MMELIVGMVILAIVAMALTRVMVSQVKFFDKQKTSNLARSVSRGPLNRVVSDLRMVEALGGVVAASASSVQVRVPYAIGLVCASAGGFTHISLLPVDSSMFASTGFSGYAWRNGAGVYAYVEAGVSAPITGDLGICTGAGISSLTTQGAKIIKISPALVADASVGTPVMLFRRVIYSFEPSAAVPGSRGLFRTVVATNSKEELSAPYETSALFRFFVQSSLTSQAAPPANLSTLRGLELLLNGTSEYIPSGAATRQRAPFTTAVFFKNRLD